MLISLKEKINEKQKFQIAKKKTAKNHPHRLATRNVVANHNVRTGAPQRGFGRSMEEFDLLKTPQI